MALAQDYDQQDCPVARALELVGERWTMLIIRDCFLGVSRFNDFLDHLDIPKATLSSRLAKLVDTPGCSGAKSIELDRAITF